jgi:MFS family permease
MHKRAPSKNYQSSLVFIAHGANDICWFVVPLVLPVLLDRFSIGYGGAGTILTSYLLVNAVFSFLIGKLSDRISRITIITIGFFVAFAGLVLAGFAKSLTGFMACVMFTALGVSSFHPVAYAFLDESVSEKKSRAYGAFEFWGAVALITMFLLNGYLLAIIGYEGVLIVTGIPSLAVGILFLKNRSRLTMKVGTGTPQPVTAQKGKERNSSLILLFIMSIILRVLSVTPVLNFIPVYLNRELGLLPRTAALASALYFCGNMIGAFLSGRISERFGPFRPILVFTGLIVPIIFLLGLSVPLWATLLLFVLLGITGGGCIPAQNLMLGLLGSRFSKGGLFGFFMGITTVANAISPALFGIASDAWGIHRAMRVFSAPSLAGFVILGSLSVATTVVALSKEST